MNLVLALLLLLQATAARPGVVTGQLQTREGMPAAAIRISALPAPPPNIRPSDGQNYYAATAPASTALTDAQGRYRLANLAPGRYFVIASVLRVPDVLSGHDQPGWRNGDHGQRRRTCRRWHQLHDTDAARRPSQRPNHVAAGGRIARRRRSSQASCLASCWRRRSARMAHSPSAIFRKAAYPLSLFPTPPGMPSRPLQVGETDVRVILVRPTLRTVSGRIVAPPRVVRRVLVGFSTERSYVTATTSADGSFSAQLQPARHRIELGGLPPGYTLGSARLGNQDVSKGVPVGGEDISGLVITIADPPK